MLKDKIQDDKLTEIAPDVPHNIECDEFIRKIVNKQF